LDPSSFAKRDLTFIGIQFIGNTEQLTDLNTSLAQLSTTKWRDELPRKTALLVIAAIHRSCDASGLTAKARAVCAARD
jgi:hypothetical protein